MSLARLEKLRPGKVLIEGPSDLSDLLPSLAHPQMVPPVALFAYGEKKLNSAAFWPFAEYSPEYQAALWAIRNDAELAFIDLPVSQRFGIPEDELEYMEDEQVEEAVPSVPDLITEHGRDPFTILGQLAGYEDGESFWNDFFETDGKEGAFDAMDTVIDAMRDEEELSQFAARREAHMRLEIAMGLQGGKKSCRSHLRRLARACAKGETHREGGSRSSQRL